MNGPDIQHRVRNMPVALHILSTPPPAQSYDPVRRTGRKGKTNQTRHKMLQGKLHENNYGLKKAFTDKHMKPYFVNGFLGSNGKNGPSHTTELLL